MHDENINTVPELEAFIGKLSKQIDDLETERNQIDNKRRRAKTEDEKESFKADKRNISAQIKPIRDKLKIAKATLDSSVTITKLIDIERGMEKKIKDKKKEEHER